jgi:hypothetical protein
MADNAANGTSRAPRALAPQFPYQSGNDVHIDPGVSRLSQPVRHREGRQHRADLGPPARQPPLDHAGLDRRRRGPQNFLYFIYQGQGRLPV